jgi:radical SAM superfamily enzyme YgiQ (UPF0313 family)
MRIALVFNPFSYKLHEENLRVVQRFFGMFPPLSLCWVSAIAKSAGHESLIIDARTENLSMEQTLARLKAFKPDIIGFMVTTYMFRETLEWIRFLKKGLNVPVVVGGFNLRVYPLESLSPPEIDFGVVESALTTLPALLHELEHDRNFDAVPGLVYKNGDRVIKTPPPEIPDRFVDYPFPDRENLPHELYEEFPTERKNFTVMVTSKGCPMACTFCEAGRTPYDPRTAQQVVDEMEICYRDYGIREIDIFDYEFPLDRKRTLEICSLIQERNLDILWACRSRVDSLDDELVREMRAAGCGRIYMGIETGSQAILDQLNKKISIPQIEKTIKTVKQHGIRPLGFFLVGVPGETRNSIRQTVKFAKRLDLDYVQFSKLTAKPLTSLWRNLVDQTGVDYWSEYIQGTMEEAALPRPWTELPNHTIDKMTRWAYLTYHLRPAFIFRAVKDVASVGEFIRKARAAIEMLFSQEKVAEAWTLKKRAFSAYYQRNQRK